MREGHSEEREGSGEGRETETEGKEGAVEGERERGWGRGGTITVRNEHDGSHIMRNLNPGQLKVFSRVMITAWKAGPFQVYRHEGLR